MTFISQELHFSINNCAANLHFSIETTKQIVKKVQIESVVSICVVKYVIELIYNNGIMLYICD